MFSRGGSSNSAGRKAVGKGASWESHFESAKWGDDGRVGPHAPKLRFVCMECIRWMIG